ncbi:unnamed protein product [Paramecium octaurelia]|uniref:Ribosomal protein S17 n=1 Tax=Paramecium octaurelia TaxID=43137 RepID=A0A8S1WT27_PAROT|nr:unnamed protein product [Paramecium octaurelia]
MQTVWTLIHPTRISVQKTIKNLLPSGQEFFGTVTRDSRNKSCKVKVSYKYWHKKYKSYFGNSSEFIAHDEDNFCKVGDKVVIKHCQKTGGKYYYVRNVVIPVGRNPSHEYDEVMNELQNIRTQLVQSGL